MTTLKQLGQLTGLMCKQAQEGSSFPVRIEASELPGRLRDMISDIDDPLIPLFKSVDTLGGQVQKYYKNAPGGFPQAVSDALAAQERRPLVPWQAADKRLQDYPRWKKKDLDRPISNYWVPAEGQGRAPSWGFRGPAAGYYRRVGDIPAPFIATGITLPETFSPGAKNPDRRTKDDKFNPLDVRSYAPQPVRIYNNEPVLSGGSLPFTPGMEIPRQQIIREHELTHHAMVPPAAGRIQDRLGYGPGRPAKFPTRNPPGTPEWVGQRQWDYMTTPTEMDPRIAEIKRSYIAAHPGSTVRTDAEARRAWKWWGEHLKHENNWLDRIGLPGTWGEGAYWKRLNQDPVEREAILKRMQEIVRSDSPVAKQAGEALKQLGQLTGLMCKQALDPGAFISPLFQLALPTSDRRVPMWKQYGRIAPGAMAHKKIQVHRAALPKAKEESDRQQWVPFGPGVAAPRGYGHDWGPGRNLGGGAGEWYKPGLSRRSGPLYPGGMNADESWAEYARQHWGQEREDEKTKQRTVMPWHPDASWKPKNTLRNWGAWLRDTEAMDEVRDEIRDLSPSLDKYRPMFFQGRR